ncbi:hypothetical protein RB195_008148 [Necator americanus]|uniref:Uncharacterized protein n=1 Tax=Necator americanus TaxID=51031 RepID=A0ABR1CP86_NECAM
MMARATYPRAKLSIKRILEMCSSTGFAAADAFVRRTAKSRKMPLSMGRPCSWARRSTDPLCQPLISTTTLKFLDCESKSARLTVPRVRVFRLSTWLLAGYQPIQLRLPCP